MSRTTEDSKIYQKGIDLKGSRVLFLNCYEERNKKDGYTIEVGEYNEKDCKEVNVLNIQEITTHDAKLYSNGIIKGKGEFQVKDGDFKLVNKRLNTRMTKHAIDLRNKVEQR